MASIQTWESAVNILDWCLKDANKDIVKAFVIQFTEQLQNVMFVVCQKVIFLQQRKNVEEILCATNI